jgi:hypothetical protein
MPKKARVRHGFFIFEKEMATSDEVLEVYGPIERLREEGRIY